MTLTPQALVDKAKQDIREIGVGEVVTPGTPGVLIDVREPDEFSAGHLAGAISIPRGVLEFQIETHPALASLDGGHVPVRERPIILYCRSGARSALAASSLMQMGFTHVSSMAGGITAWQEAGKPITAD